jgi:hypothetical protein
MKKKLKGLLAVVLSMAFVLTATPLSGFAAEQTVESRLPKTSDPTPTWLGLAAVIGIVLVVVALLVRGRKKK